MLLGKFGSGGHASTYSDKVRIDVFPPSRCGRSTFSEGELDGQGYRGDTDADTHDPLEEFWHFRLPSLFNDKEYLFHSFIDMIKPPLCVSARAANQY